MSEVSIDKVMADISSFRQRLAMLREELGRANRSMADKMSQLGETLTQRVRDLRDQVTTAPQNLLALESRFMSGDMPEQEYKATREEYRNQLTKNLRSIDEVRSLLLIMSQLDALPSDAPAPLLVLGPTAPEEISNDNSNRIGWVTFVGGSSMAHPSGRVEIISPDNLLEVNLFIEKCIQESESKVIVGDFLDNVIRSINSPESFYSFFC